MTSSPTDWFCETDRRMGASVGSTLQSEGQHSDLAQALRAVGKSVTASVSFFRYGQLGWIKRHLVTASFPSGTSQLFRALDRNARSSARPPSLLAPAIGACPCLRRTGTAPKKADPQDGPAAPAKGGGLRQIPLSHRFHPREGIETMRRLPSSGSKRRFDISNSLLISIS